VQEVRLSLVVDESDRRLPEWAVRIVHYARFPRLLARRGGVEEIARFGDNFLRNDASRILEAVKIAVERMA
jgi:hypothetical protein